MDTLTMVEIIDETVEFYDGDPTRRSKRVGVGGLGLHICSYNGDEGNHCAVGRCLTQEALMNNPDKHSDATVSGVWKRIKALDHDLQPQYRGHTLLFWKRLQHLHDCERFWDCDGITQFGRREALSMSSKFMR